MDQLRFTGLHEDGAHLVVTAADGSDFAVPIDERMRSALRHSSGAPTARTSATPREVQTQIRAGSSNADVAALTGWEVERVQRYEGPILAEREHIAGLARQALVRTHDRSGPPPSLEGRVRDRLHVRGVDLDKVQWDAMRPDGGQWSVVVRFMAGQRIRQAAWTFDLSARSVDAVDDEARWLSEDEQSLPAGAPSSALFGAGMDAPDDLMSTMRERSRRRGQGRQRKNSSATEQSTRAHRGADTDLDGEVDADFDADPEFDVEATDETEPRNDTEASGDPAALPAGVTDQALPLEDLPYDPDTMGLPPAAGREASDVADDGERVDAGTDSGHDADDVDVDVDVDVDDSLEDVEEMDEEDSREATLADFFGSDDIDDEDVVDEDVVDEDVEIDDGDRQIGAAETGSAEDVSAEETPAPSTSRSRKGRPSVPSWDDIMFGARDQDR